MVRPLIAAGGLLFNASVFGALSYLLWRRSLQQAGEWPAELMLNTGVFIGLMAALAALFLGISLTLTRQAWRNRSLQRKNM